MSGIKQQARILEALIQEQDALQGAVRFTAYRQRGGCEATTLASIVAANLDKALPELTTSGLEFADTLFVHEEHAGRRVNVLHAYRIRKSKAIWQRNPQTGLSERVEPLKADHLFSLPVDAFQPTRPFDAFRDSANGVDASLVERLP